MPRPSSSRPTRCSSRRCATLSASTSTRPSMRWCCASTKRAKCRRSIARSRSCRMLPGQAERRSHDYKRHGTTSAVRRSRCRHRQRARALLCTASRDASSASFLDAIERTCQPISISISSWTTTPPTRRRRSKPGSLSGRAIMLHFTPTYASWLNQVERWFALLTERQIRRGVHRSVKELEAAIPPWTCVRSRQRVAVPCGRTQEFVICTFKTVALTHQAQQKSPLLPNSVVENAPYPQSLR